MTLITTTLSVRALMVTLAVNSAQHNGFQHQVYLCLPVMAAQEQTRLPQHPKVQDSTPTDVAKIAKSVSILRTCNVSVALVYCYAECLYF